MQIPIPAPDSLTKYYESLTDYERGKFDATVNGTIAFSLVFGTTLNLLLWGAAVKRRACIW